MRLKTIYEDAGTNNVNSVTYKTTPQFKKQQWGTVDKNRRRDNSILGRKHTEKPTKNNGKQKR